MLRLARLSRLGGAERLTTLGVSAPSGGTTGSTGGTVAGSNRLALRNARLGALRGVPTASVTPPPSGGTGGTVDTTGLGFFPLSGPTYRGRAAAENQRAYLGNSYTVIEKIERQNASTGRWDGVSGLTLTVFLATTPDGANGAIGSLAGTMAEVEGAPGVYALQFSVAAVADLTAFANQTVYEIISDGATLTVYNEVLVLPTRQGA